MSTLVLLNAVICLMILAEETEGAFDDLGKLLFGGVAAAVIFALALSLVRLRLRDKNPPTSDFISISASDHPLNHTDPHEQSTQERA